MTAASSPARHATAFLRRNDVGVSDAAPAGLGRGSLFRRRGLGEQVGSSSLRLRRNVLAKQEVNRPFPSGGEQRSLMSCLVVSPAADHAEVGCEPHREGKQTQEPHERPQQHSGNATDGNKRHRRGDHQSRSEDEGIERRRAVMIGGGGRQTDIGRKLAAEVPRHVPIVSQTRRKRGSCSDGDDGPVPAEPIGLNEQKRGPA